MQRLLLLFASLINAGLIIGCGQQRSQFGDADSNTEAVESGAVAGSVQELAPNASGLCLAEVVEIAHYDERGADGDEGIRVKLRKVKGSGEFHEVINIITRYGGLRSGPYPAIPSLLRPSTFRVHERYWIAFASVHDLERHPQWVVDFWKEGENASTEALLNKAIVEDVYCWNPRYDPKTKLTYGRMIENTTVSGEKGLSIHVKRDAEVLWRKFVPGTMSDRYSSWNLYDVTDTRPTSDFPLCGRVLVCETARELEQDNEYDLAPQKVYLQTTYDLVTGARLTAKISRQQPGFVPILCRKYDPQTGQIMEETKEIGWGPAE